MTETGHYWVRVEGRGYFVRFESHAPPKWFTHQRLSHANCFASAEDAWRVAEQLKAYGREAAVVKQRIAPPTTPLGVTLAPPERLRRWVKEILLTGRANGSSGSDCIRTGFRALARQHHPDVGGLTADMQNLSEALAWLEQNETPLWCSGYFDTADEEIPF
jgi:hypothetical protein